MSSSGISSGLVFSRGTFSWCWSMPERSDYMRMVQRIDAEAKAEHVHELRTQLPRLMDVTTKAQMVIDHPGWQLFADKIESRIADVEKGREAKTHAMIFGKAMGHELELLKIELNTMDAEVAGLRYALTLITEAIDAGELISKGVVNAG